MKNITVIDSIMGSGKTTWMLDYLNNKFNTAPFKVKDCFTFGAPKYLYVTPMLAEVARVQSHCATLDFRDPQPIEGRKLYHLKTLLEEGKNVCTTHALFSMLNREIYELLKTQKYTLVIDEVVTCVEMFKSISKADQKLLFEQGFISIDSHTSRLQWNHAIHSDYEGRFEDIKNLCDNGNLVAYLPKKSRTRPLKPSEEAVVLIWEFPSEFLRCFQEVYILTYLFHGSPMMSYFEAEGLSFTMKAIHEKKLVDWDQADEGQIKEALRPLVKLYPGSMNDIGDPIGKNNPLSSSWFVRANDEVLDQLRASTQYFFTRVAKCKSANAGWTTFQKVRRKLKGKGYAKGFISVNTKATNDYRHKTTMAYLANIFHQPIIKSYFEERGITVYEDIYALSEMIQWIWRSQIREGKPINLFIPSKRMRDLFQFWLESDDTVALLKKDATRQPSKIRRSCDCGNAVVAPSAQI
jgi:hypothetical protein